MIEYTENYQLLKPGKSEKYTIEHQNQNMELIDAALHDFDGRMSTFGSDVGNILDAIATIPAQCSYASHNFALTAEDLPSSGSCTLRFIAPAAYVKSDTLTVNGVSYALTMVNGKALGNDAWVLGAVVSLQLDSAEHKAFFSGGGADLSFVTAGAEQILSGYVGADAEGEPVSGTAESWITEMVSGTFSVTATNSGQVAPMQREISFGGKGKPKAIAIVAVAGYTTPTHSTLTALHGFNTAVVTWIDGFIEAPVYSQNLGDNSTARTEYPYYYINVDDDNLILTVVTSTSYSTNATWTFYYELYY